MRFGMRVTVSSSVAVVFLGVPSTAARDPFQSPDRGAHRYVRKSTYPGGWRSQVTTILLSLWCLFIISNAILRFVAAAIRWHFDTTAVAAATNAASASLNGQTAQQAPVRGGVQRPQWRLRGQMVGAVRMAWSAGCWMPTGVSSAIGADRSGQPR